MTKKQINKNKIHGFTIVELLVVIVIIGVLAAIIIVSYGNIANKAAVASIKSDLSSNGTKLKAYNVEYGSYPTSLDASNCPSAPNTAPSYCIKLSGDTTLESYTGTSTTFRLVIKIGANYGVITESTEPVILSVPTLTDPTSSDVGYYDATIGATLQSDGGAAVTETGMCWGTSPNPTTNCVANHAGDLYPLSPFTINVAGYGAPWSVIMSPDSSHLYIPGNNNGNLYMYGRNNVTGQISALSPATVSNGTNSAGAAISPDGASVYVANRVTSSVSMYSRNASTGQLTALSPATIASGTEPWSVEVAGSGTSVYVANHGSSNISMYSRNASTGQLTALSPATIAAGSGTQDLVISPTGNSVYAVNNNANTISMYSRNTSTGQLTALSPATITTGSYPYSICISNDGNSVYVTTSTGVYMYSRNTSTGQLTALSPAYVSAGSESINVTSDGTAVYSTDNSGYVYVQTRNVSTGMLSAASTAMVSHGQYLLSSVFSPDDKFYYAISQGNSQLIMAKRRINVSDTGFFSQSRVSMPPNTTIYFRGYAKNAVGTGYSPDGTFQTWDDSGG